MWELLIIFVTLNTQFLHAYETKEACQAERDRIGFIMAESYPQEHSFDIVCRLKKAVI